VTSWGPLLAEIDVDQAVVRTLRQWMPYYLTQAEVERDLDVGTIARPVEGSYANTLETDEFEDHQLPAVIVTTAQMEDPMMDGDGVYRAEFRTRVSAVCRGRTPQETRAVTSVFSACVKRVMVQQSSLGGFASGVALRGGMLTAIDDATDAGRYLAAGVSDFVVFVDAVVQAGEGPYVPPDGDPVYEPPDQPDDPWDPLASVEVVTVSVEPKENP
jgi:hypothetical protein